MPSSQSLAGLMKWLPREPWRDAFADVLEQHLGASTREGMGWLEGGASRAKRVRPGGVAPAVFRRIARARTAALRAAASPVRRRWSASGPRLAQNPRGAPKGS